MTETHEPIEIEIPAGGNRLGLILASGMGVVLVALIAVLATSETNQGLGPSPLITQAAPLIAGPTVCLLYTSPSPRDKRQSRMPSSA